MIAALIHLTIDPELAPKAAQAFSAEILPRVRLAAGFCEGFWLDPEDGKGFGFLLFEDEATAKAAVPPRTAWSAPGVEIGEVKFRRVAVAVTP